MAPAKPRYLHDYFRFGANAEITCPECGHSVVYATRNLVDYFHAKRWNQSLDVAGAHFRCDRCHHKGARIAMAPAVAPPDPPKLVTIADRKQEARRRRG